MSQPNPTMHSALNGQSRINGQLATNEADWSGTSPLYGAYDLWAGYYQEIGASINWAAGTVEGMANFVSCNPPSADKAFVGIDTEIVVPATNTQVITSIDGYLVFTDHGGTGAIGTLQGVNCDVQISGGAAVTTRASGCRFGVAMTSSGTVADATGCFGTVTHTSAGACTLARGYRATVQNNHATGTMPTAVGFEAEVSSLAAGVLTNGYDFLAKTPTGTGTVTTLYGFYCEALARAGITTTWGVYVVSDQVHFGGNAEFTGSAAVIQIGGGATAATLRFMEPSASGTNYSEFKAQAQAGNVTYTLPAADGSNRQTLHTDGAGALTWAAVVLTTDVSGILPVANGGTNSGTALNNNRVMVSSAGTIIEAAAATNGQLLIGSTGAAPVVAALTAGAGIAITNAAGAITIAANETIDLVIIIGDGTNAITTGVKGFLPVDFAFTIVQWTLVADASGSIVIDVWKDTYANFPPTVADTIAGTEKPTLSSVQKNQDTSLTTWTTSVAAGDVLGFNVDSATTVKQVTLTIKCTKTS